MELLHQAAILKLVKVIFSPCLSLQQIVAAIPISVSIGKQTFFGARYTEDRDCTQEESLYLIGELPASYRRSNKVCYRTADSDREWYIAAWFLKTGENVEYHECHPFGSHFLLAVWSVPSGGTIDKYEPTPYRRVPMILTVLGPDDTDVKQSPKETKNGD